jgi:hypothetical protein
MNEETETIAVLPEPDGYDSKTDTCTVTLSRPLVIGSEEITDIVIKAPTWADLDSIKFKGKDVDFDLATIRKLAFQMSNVGSEAYLKKISGKDIKKIINVVMYFLQTALT